MKTVGIIGVGNMGGCIFNALTATSRYKVISSDGAENVKIARESDILILAVKPNVVAAVAEEIKTHISENAVIVSIAAGLTLHNLYEMFGDYKTVRAMPNLCVKVNEGMTAICGNFIELDEIKSIFEYVGKCEIVDEKLMDVVTAVSGGGPAFVAMMLEAMSDGAVLEGMPRDLAYTLETQTVLGTIKLLMETKIHPAELKNAVCSPNGTTIESVRTLENHAFRAGIIEAIAKATEKSRRLRQ